MAFTSRTAELFSRYRYRDDNNHNNDVEYDDMEVASTDDNSESDGHTDTQQDGYYNYNEEIETAETYNEDSQTSYKDKGKGNYSFNKPVLHLREVCEDGTYDWSIFVRYEQHDNYIVYGIRKSSSLNNLKRSKYNQIRLKFLGRETVLAFFRHAFCSVSSKLNVTMYNMRFDDNYEGTYQYYANTMLTSKNDELFGYDEVDINMNTLNDYLTLLRYSWN